MRAFLYFLSGINAVYLWEGKKRREGDEVEFNAVLIMFHSIPALLLEQLINKEI